MYGQERDGDRGFLLSQLAQTVRVQWWHWAAVTRACVPGSVEQQWGHSHLGCQGSPSSLLQQTRKPAAPEQTPLAMFSPQHHQRWFQPRAEHYLPSATGCQLPLAVYPHAEAISTSPSLAEKPSHFAGKEKSQAFEQWQKCLQPASFQARRPLGIKQKSLGCWLAIAKCGARSGCQPGQLDAAPGAGCGRMCRDSSPERCRDLAAVQQLQLQPLWGSGAGSAPWRVSALWPC